MISWAISHYSKISYVPKRCGRVQIAESCGLLSVTPRDAQKRDSSGRVSYRVLPLDRRTVGAVDVSAKADLLLLVNLAQGHQSISHCRKFIA